MTWDTSFLGHLWGSVILSIKRDCGPKPVITYVSRGITKDNELDVDHDKCTHHMTL